MRVSVCELLPLHLYVLHNKGARLFWQAYPADTVAMENVVFAVIEF